METPNKEPMHTKEPESWEKEMDDTMSHLNWQSCICCGRYRNHLKPAIKDLLSKQREEIVEECIKIMNSEITAGNGYIDRERIGVRLEALKK